MRTPTTNPRTFRLYHAHSDVRNIRSLMPREALGLLALAMVLLAIASPLIAALDLMGAAGAQILLIGTPTILWLRLRKVSIPIYLGVHRPGARAIAGAILVGISAWFVNLHILLPAVQSLSGYSASKLERQMEAYGTELLAGVPLPLALLVFAALPAICEEILMRGAVTRALLRRFGPTFAMLGSATLFGLMHIVPVPIRFVPAASFGAILAFAMIASGSIVPGVIMHVLNNAIALVLVSGAIADWPQLASAHGDLLSVVALSLTVSGLAMLRSCDRG